MSSATDTYLGNISIAPSSWPAPPHARAIRTSNKYVINPLMGRFEADWLRNVLAAGRATISADGETHEVTAPNVLDAAAALPLPPPKKRRRYERLGVESYLKVMRA